MNKEKKQLSRVNQRVEFFYHFFEKTMGYVGHYKSLSNIIFDTRTFSVHAYTTSITQRNNYITQQQSVDTYNTHHKKLNTLMSKQVTQNKEIKQFELNQVNWIKSSKRFFSINKSINKLVLKQHKMLFNSALVDKFFTLNYFQKEEKNRTDVLKTFYSSPIYMDNLETRDIRIERNSASNQSIIHRESNVSMDIKEVKALECRVVERIQEQIKIGKEAKLTEKLSHEERLIVQSEEKRVFDRIYNNVMKRLDREQSRRGHLYESK